MKAVAAKRKKNPTETDLIQFQLFIFFLSLIVDENALVNYHAIEMSSIANQRTAFMIEC